MARIRSIKPEFWSDAKIKRLSHGCIAFFIGLWNFCDDEGKSKTDPLELSLKLSLFRSQDIVKYLRMLAESGLIQLSTGADWLLITNWNHQKIDKPRVPKTLKENIEWSPILTKQHSPTTLRTLVDTSTNVRRKDRIGSDRIGSGSDKVPAPEQAALVPVQIPLIEGPFTKDLRGKVWAAYRETYFARYGKDPVRNQKVNSQIKQLAERLGADAPDVVRFYVSHNKTYYVSKCHEVGACLIDAESLHTQWVKGKAITNSDLKRFERGVDNNELDRMINEGKI